MSVVETPSIYTSPHLRGAGPFDHRKTQLVVYSGTTVPVGDILGCGYQLGLDMYTGPQEIKRD